MSYVQLSEGGFQVVYPLACGPGSPELPKSYMDMASKLFSFTSTCPITTSALAMQSEHRTANPAPAR